MTIEKDVMSVEYTELDNGCPALCFCSDLITPITNKTMLRSFCSFVDNDLAFKIHRLQIQNVAFTTIGENLVYVEAKINSKTKFVPMGYVYIHDLYKAIKKAIATLEESSESEA